MKTLIAAMAFIFALSANAGMTSAHDDEHDGYEQHESKDHGDKDRHEHGDKDKDRGSQHTADRNDGLSTESDGFSMPDWWPF